MSDDDDTLELDEIKTEKLFMFFKLLRDTDGWREIILIIVRWLKSKIKIKEGE